MDKIDQKRREEYKEYEMRKKAQEDHRLAQMSEDERKRTIQEIKEQEKRHSDHDQVKHPGLKTIIFKIFLGGREQLEEVWEERDKVKKF